MQITDTLEITASPFTRKFIVNVTTGALVVNYNTDNVSSEINVTEVSEITVAIGASLTFSLNGDTATIEKAEIC